MEGLKSKYSLEDLLCGMITEGGRAKLTDRFNLKKSSAHEPPIHLFVEGSQRADAGWLALKMKRHAIARNYFKSALEGFDTGGYFDEVYKLAQELVQRGYTEFEPIEKHYKKVVDTLG